MKLYRLLVLLLLCQLLGCSKSPKANTVNNDNSKKAIAPSFCSDSAYFFVEKQVNFGPRVPNSKSHQLCGDFLEKTLKAYGATVTVQKVDVTAFDGTVLHARNILGQIAPEKKTRILLLSHWDCRPWSDNDINESHHNMPVDGANDGASGVGILLEIARQLSIKPADIGVDILFTDAEDYGAPEWIQSVASDSWCLGSKAWAKWAVENNYSAQYGILLDMVGAPNAKFGQELFSQQYALHIVGKIWSEAKNLGYANLFVTESYGGITDDHLPLNTIANIPTADIIHFDENGFGAYWHTQNDNMKNISKPTLQAVGEVLLSVIYNEKP